jgi:hypothetical protein
MAYEHSYFNDSSLNLMIQPCPIHNTEMTKSGIKIL